MNNGKVNANTLLVKIYNNKYTINPQNYRDCTEIQEYENQNKPPKHRIDVTAEQTQTNGAVINIVNDLSKPQSPITEKNSTDFVMRVKEPTPNKPRAPIMGCSALLKKAHSESNESLIIHELITDKYRDVLNHFDFRMHKRKLSRQENSVDDSSEMLYSSTPGCSPMSLNTSSTANSTGPDEKNGFSFPNPQKPDYRFMASTDDTNIETTTEEFEAMSVKSTDTGHEKSSSVSDYDVAHFLENALGGITNSNRSASSSDMQEERHSNHDDHNVENSDSPSLLSKTTSLYTSVKKNMKRRCSFKSSTATIPKDPGHDNSRSTSFNNSLLENLMRELSIQNEIMFQVTKALNYCKTTKEFESSVELVEAEKILLVALCTKEALSKEIQNIQDDTYEKKDDYRSCGQVDISNLKFPAKNINKTDTPTGRDFTEKFLVILRSASTVLASDVVVADQNGGVNIDTTFKFIKLPIDFEISICIYSMRVDNKSQQEQKSNCPCPKKIFCQKYSRKPNKVLQEVTHIKPSSFSLRGKCKIRNSELLKTSQSDSSHELTLSMYNTASTSSLSGVFSMNIKSQVKLINKFSGFLTIGIDNDCAVTIWNRRWCILDGPNLKYWNYPSEEITNPLEIIDLSYCIDQQIGSADRGVCARPRTLLLPIRHDQTVKKYFLSADDYPNMKQWETELNYVIFAMKIWNCINK